MALAPSDLPAVDVADFERGLPLIWRAAPAGGTAGGSACTERTFTYLGAALRPWAPCHVRAVTQESGDIALSWTRRDRSGADGWDQDAPMSETVERYRVSLVRDGEEVTIAEVDEPVLLWTAAMQETLPGEPAAPGGMVQVRQWSEAWGWGPAGCKVI